MKSNTIKLLIFIFFISAITACTSTNNSVGTKRTMPSQGEYHYKESAVLWQQHAAEYAALCYQAFNMAKTSLEMEPVDSRMRDAAKPPAIVMDLDETVLNNSPYNGYLALNMESYSQSSWKEWTSQSEAELVPGALEFIQSVKQMGIALFYISNRREDELEATLKNLEIKGVSIEPNYILLRNGSRSKETRRDAVLRNFNIAMLLGDNLADFDNAFEQELNITERKELVQRFRDEFGRKFIILPNAMYGDWERTMKIEDSDATVKPERPGNQKYLKDF